MEMQSYFEACKERNLIEDDYLWVRTMAEAETQYRQKYLIRLFAYIVVFNEVNDPFSLWWKFKFALSKEHIHSYNLEDIEAEYLTLKELRDIFKIHQKTNKDFNLPEP